MQLLQKLNLFSGLLCEGVLRQNIDLHSLVLLLIKLVFFCEDFQEHLFFLCPVISQGWQVLLQWMGTSRNAYGWHRKIEVLTTAVKGKKEGSRILKMLVAEFVYAVWIEQNMRIFQDVRKTMDQLVRKVVFAVICRSAMHPKLAQFCI